MALRPTTQGSASLAAGNADVGIVMTDSIRFRLFAATLPDAELREPLSLGVVVTSMLTAARSLFMEADRWTASDARAHS
jgi:hypothetical protein